MTGAGVLWTNVFFALSFIFMVVHTVHAMLCERKLRLSNPHGTFRMTPLQQLAGKEDFTPRELWDGLYRRLRVSFAGIGPGTREWWDAMELGRMGRSVGRMACCCLGGGWGGAAGSDAQSELDIEANECGRNDGNGKGASGSKSKGDNNWHSGRNESSPGPGWSCLCFTFKGRSNDNNGTAAAAAAATNTCGDGVGVGGYNNAKSDSGKGVAIRGVGSGCNSARHSGDPSDGVKCTELCSVVSSKAKAEAEQKCPVDAKCAPNKRSASMSSPFLK